MLVLTRKVGESVLLGHEIEITVIRIDGGHLRLGIRAPREVPVVRSELLDSTRASTRVILEDAPIDATAVSA